MKSHLFLVLSLPLLLAPSACNRGEQPPAASTPKAQVIETTPARRQPVTSRLVLPARITANPTKMVHIFPMISGRVLSLRILPGQEVRKGQTIGTLQSSDAAQARSDYQKAKIEADRADLQLSRAQELLKHDVMAQRDYDDLKALDQADHAELDRARATLRMLGFSENATSDIVPIAAPISGVVLDIGTAAGEMQRSLDNATSIATIADIDSIWVVGDLYPRDQAAVRTGQPADIAVNGYPGLTLHGTIDNISDAVDPVSMTLKVRVVLPNPGHRLKPAMYASMTILGSRQEIITVPATAVIQNGHNTFVFVETSTGKYQRRDVVLGDTSADSDQITQGLSEGDRVVTAGAELLRASEGQ